MKFGSLSATDFNEGNFFDGAQDIVPDGTVTLCVVDSGTAEVPAGKAKKSIRLNFKVCESIGEDRKPVKSKYHGYKIAKNFSELLDLSANNDKKEKLGHMIQVVDYQAGSPMASLDLDIDELNSDHISDYWKGAKVLLKWGVFVPKPNEETGQYKPEELDDEGNPKPVQFVRGLSVSAKYRKDEVKIQTPEEDFSDFDEFS